MDIRPVTLEGAHVRLEALDVARHWDGLRTVLIDDELWRLTSAKVSDEASLRAYLDSAVADVTRGAAVAFATIDRASGRIAGTTRFGNIERKHRRVEIGWTYVGREFQRTRVNTNAKLLMFAHAFDVWGMRRVELKTSHRNLRSQNAMRRLGLVEEGVLRKHMIDDDGENRNSVYFSVIDDEWPAMRARLEGMLAAR